MDFDEYEYLEKTVENLDSLKKDSTNGRSAARSEDKDRSRSSKHRDDGHHRSKRAKSEGEGDGQRDRESSRHGASDRHRREREPREERNGRDNERDRKRVSERESDRAREGDRARERERDRPRRSSSRSERHVDDERDRHSERSKETEHSRSKETEHSRSKETEHSRDFRERDHRDPRRREKKDEGAEPEADPERDQRTVFAYQICLKADERDVYEFFSRAGKVRDVRLIMDRNSRRSKGVGYIEFYDAMSVPMAIALSGQLLLGQPVMVKPSEAEKNLVQSTATSAGAGGLSGPFSGGARKLYVGNLHFNMTEDQLRQVFEPFGAVELVQLPLDPETGHCKGFGFVQFTRLEDAKAAQSLNGQLEIAGRTIKVSAMSDQAGVQDVGTNAGDLDDDDGGGLSLNARSRALLMQKLDRSGTATNVSSALVAPVSTPLLPVPPASVLGAPPLNPLIQSAIPGLAGLPTAALAFATTTQTVENIGIPSECLLLKNMFDPNVETDPDFDLDIKEDVQEECSKFGTVKHIYVEKNSAGFVYLRFENTNAAMNAQRALHGRWFAGKMITATFMLPQNYEAKFPN
ncbi:RNA-binding protein 39 [Dendrobium catenatum]|uniref:Nucleolin 1 n=1 Tax=Dendrobium catenatum TaxID=906689 RepID=A0A2I0XCM0_9ASPA|nr:RNA-binding protein 39 [Dendrobium catenatum]PKU85655.1 Nucleolin 1 [Dendrobium catenatum]